MIIVKSTLFFWKSIKTSLELYPNLEGLRFSYSIDPYGNSYIERVVVKAKSSQVPDIVPQKTSQIAPHFYPICFDASLVLFFGGGGGGGINGPKKK